MSESISFIVSVYDRPHFLNACLASLAVNPDPKQIIVCDNSPNPTIFPHASTEMQGHIQAVCDRYMAMNVRTGEVGCKECYDSANWVIEKWCEMEWTAQKKGEAETHRMRGGTIEGGWLCFPSDDSLYVCGFTEIMLGEAHRTSAGLVYCDIDYRSANPASKWKSYSILETEPRMGRIDKISFILRRELFIGFPPHPKGWRDGALVEQLVQQGVKTAKAPGVLVLHQ